MTLLHAAMLSFSFAAVESSTESVSPYEVDFALDGVATGAALGLLLLTEGVVKFTMSAGPPCRVSDETGHCDPNDLNAFDRLAVGRRSRAWFLTTDITVLLGYLTPLIALGVDSWTSRSRTPGRDYAADVLVIAEATAVAALATSILKHAVRRPRPTNYSANRFSGSFEHQLSFPSGHATAAAAATTAFSTTFAYRHPTSPWRYVVIGTGILLTALTAYGRVAHGFHFPSDVIAGVLVGGLVGFAVPSMHRKRRDVAACVVPAATGTNGLVLKISGGF